MTTTLGELVSELMETYERTYNDPELAAVAAAVTLEEMFECHVAKRARPEQTSRIRRQK
jgi:hypothetical protein